MRYASKYSLDGRKIKLFMSRAGAQFDDHRTAWNLLKRSGKREIIVLQVILVLSAFNTDEGPYAQHGHTFPPFRAVRRARVGRLLITVKAREANNRDSFGGISNCNKFVLDHRPVHCDIFCTVPFTIRAGTEVLQSVLEF